MPQMQPTKKDFILWLIFLALAIAINQGGFDRSEAPATLPTVSPFDQHQPGATPIAMSELFIASPNNLPRITTPEASKATCSGTPLVRDIPTLGVLGAVFGPLNPKGQPIGEGTKATIQSGQQPTFRVFIYDECLVIVPASDAEVPPSSEIWDPSPTIAY